MRKANATVNHRLGVLRTCFLCKRGRSASVLQYFAGLCSCRRKCDLNYPAFQRVRILLACNKNNNNRASYTLSLTFSSGHPHHLVRWLHAPAWHITL